MKNSPLLMLCIAAALAACHQGPDPAAAAKPAPRARAPAAAQRTAQESIAGMVEAVSQGKSQAHVSLKFDLLERPTVGQPLTIALALLPDMPASPATIAVTVGDGLRLVDDPNPIEIPSVEAARVYRETIKVTPTAEGVEFVNLVVALTHDETVESREFSVPIIVAPVPANSTAPAPAVAPAPAAAALEAAAPAANPPVNASNREGDANTRRR